MFAFSSLSPTEETVGALCDVTWCRDLVVVLMKPAMCLN